MPWFDGLDKLKANIGEGLEVAKQAAAAAAPKKPDEEEWDEWNEEEKAPPPTGDSTTLEGAAEEGSTGAPSGAPDAGRGDGADFSLSRLGGGFTGGLGAASGLLKMAQRPGFGLDALQSGEAGGGGGEADQLRAALEGAEERHQQELEAQRADLVGKVKQIAELAKGRGDQIDELKKMVAKTAEELDDARAQLLRSAAEPRAERAEEHAAGSGQLGQEAAKAVTQGEEGSEGGAAREAELEAALAAASRELSAQAEAAAEAAANQAALEAALEASQNAEQRAEQAAEATGAHAKTHVARWARAGLFQSILHVCFDV